MAASDIWLTLNEENIPMSDKNNAAFYFVSSSGPDSSASATTLDKAVEKATESVVRYGNDYWVFQAVKKVKASPKYYANAQDLSFGVTASA